MMLMTQTHTHTHKYTDSYAHSFFLSYLSFWKSSERDLKLWFDFENRQTKYFETAPTTDAEFGDFRLQLLLYQMFTSQHMGKIFLAVIFT